MHRAIPFLLPPNPATHVHAASRELTPLLPPAAFPPAHPSAAAKTPLKRQVFISHTGQDKDAKAFAASILKPALEAAGLAVYMDFKNLELGCDWPQQLVDAAANSMVVVVVLSRTYSNQFWCMLELDLALHAHPQQGGKDQSDRRPLVIPVFYDSDNVVVDVNKIRQRWSCDLLQELQKEDLGPEWVKTVNVDRWVDNIVAMKVNVQHLRNTPSSAKDGEWQLAEGVVQVAAKHMPFLVEVGEVVGFKEQEDELASKLQGRLGLWLYGQGEWWLQFGATCTFNRCHP
jgi:hypothetical protein